MTANSLTERNDERNVQTREETRSDDKYIRPAVNIIETEDGLTMIVPNNTVWSGVIINHSTSSVSKLGAEVQETPSS